MVDPFEIVPINNYGDDANMDELRAALAKVHRQVSLLRDPPTRDRVTDALVQFELWMATALREERLSK